MRSGIVVVVEGVNTGLVGAYGTNTANTPALDRLAAYGLVLDQCFVDSVDLQAQLRSLWTGRHAGQESDSAWSLWHQLVANGYEACLITDCPDTAKVAEQLGCPRVTLVEVDEPSEPAGSWPECSLMRVFVAANEELSESESNRLVWVHSRGLRLAWDAPLELRERFIDPEDPDPPSSVCLPDMKVNEGTDPDEVIGWGQVAAAQVAVVDQGIEILVSTIESRADADDWTWMVISPGGVPLGEHGRVGWGAPTLHGEEIGCLAILQSALQTAGTELRAPGSRRAEICQLPDLLVTLMDALQRDLSNAGEFWGQSLLRLGSFSAPNSWSALWQCAYISHGLLEWIRTPAWSAIFREGELPKLFVKPDDRWEVCDVASRRNDVVERLQEIAAEFKSCLKTGNRTHLSKLEDELCNLLR